LSVDFTAEAKRIVDAAQQRGAILRALGATAFKLHCPKFAVLFETLERRLTDLDFMGYKRQKNDVLDTLKQLGYSMDRSTEYIMTISDRYILRNQESNLAVDVFFDKLVMCHTIDFKDRLEVDYPTIPLAELLFEKMQIVKINEKDIKDSIILIREHDVGETDKETINGKYMANVLSNDWGFDYTVTTNLGKVRNLLPKYDALSEEDRQDVAGKIDTLLKAIEDQPKSVRWKLRAKTGTRRKWYNEVEEVQQG